MLYRAIRFCLTLVIWPVAALTVIVPPLGIWFDEMDIGQDDAGGESNP